jgi:hypothetical protein
LLSESSLEKPIEESEKVEEADEEVSKFDIPDGEISAEEDLGADEMALDDEIDAEESKEQLIDKLISLLETARDELQSNPESLMGIEDEKLRELIEMFEDEAIEADDVVDAALEDREEDNKLEDRLDGDIEAEGDMPEGGDKLLAGSYMALESLFAESLKVKTKKGQKKLMESLNKHVGNWYWVTSKSNDKDVKDFGMAQKVTKDSVTINKKTYPASSHNFKPIRGW